jgi:hypothetical protein
MGRRDDGRHTQASPRFSRLRQSIIAALDRIAEL